MLWAILLALVACLTYYLLLKPQMYWMSKNVRQGIPVPLVGDNLGTFFRISSFADMVKTIYFRFPNLRYTGMYQMTRPTLMLRDPKLIKQITVKDFDHFLDHRSFIPEDADPLWNKNLFALTGTKWREMRTTLSPAFTSSKMKGMFNLINDAAQQYTKYYEELNEKVHTLEMKDSFTRYANDVIATCAFGIKCDSLKERDNEFYVMGKEATDLSKFRKTIVIFLHLILPRLVKFLKMKLFDDNVSYFFNKIVKDTIDVRTRENIVRPDMIHLLLEARKGKLKHEDTSELQQNEAFAAVEESHVGKVEKKHAEITDADITAQALIFFFAGFETVSTLMSFMSYELALNPDVQELLRNEVDEIMDECGGKLTYDHLTKMKYMDMVVSETLRKWPPAVAVDRVCVKPYTIPKMNDESPVHIKEGDILWLPVMGIHHDEKYYPNPDRFDPERFSDDNKHSIDPFTYLPFGVGPRNCIGSRFALMETKTVFFSILSKFEITVVDKTQIPMVLCKKQFNLASENGNWLGFKRRGSL